MVCPLLVAGQHPVSIDHLNLHDSSSFDVSQYQDSYVLTSSRSLLCSRVVETVPTLTSAQLKRHAGASVSLHMPFSRPVEVELDPLCPELPLVLKEDLFEAMLLPSHLAVMAPAVSFDGHTHEAGLNTLLGLQTAPSFKFHLESKTIASPPKPRAYRVQSISEVFVDLSTSKSYHQDELGHGGT